MRSFIHFLQKWATDSRVWYGAAWVVALAILGWRWYHARQEFVWRDHKPEGARRADGNRGHTFIDFGGQWVMGRLAATGQFKELYNRHAQWKVIREGYPRSAESPLQLIYSVPGQAPSTAEDSENGHDDNKLMQSFMGSDSPKWAEVGRAVACGVAPVTNPYGVLFQVDTATKIITPEIVEDVSKKCVGGPLYPPIHAFLYSPLGLLSPQDAYYAFHGIALGFGILAAWGVSFGTRRVIPLPYALALLLLLPGCRTGLDLGQNPLITAAILVWGWALLARGYPVAGGVVWGLFAFKPIWGIAFVLVPLAMSRWRMVLAMVAMGMTLAAATLPFTGLQPWLDWMEVGKEATGVYKTAESWNNLSRDLQGLVRRIMLDFSKPKEERNTPLVDTICWAILGLVVAITVGVYRLQADSRKCIGIGAAFLCFGAYLSGFRFMYYDALLMILGWTCLLADRSGWLPTFEDWTQRLISLVRAVPVWVLVILLYSENVGWLVQLKGTIQADAWAYQTTNSLGVATTHIPKLKYELGFDYAWDTLLILWIWLWCAWRLLLGDDFATEPS